VATSPESITHLTGYDSWTIYTFRDLEVYGLLTASAEQALVAPIDAIDYLADRPASTDRIYTYGTFYIHQEPGARLTPSEMRVERMRAELPHFPTADAALQQALRDLGASSGRLGIDGRGVPAARWERLRELLGGAELELADDVLKDLRRVKTEAEIDRLRRAARAVEDGIQAAFAAARAGINEAELERIIGSTTAARGVIPGHCETSAGTRGSACFPPSSERSLRAGDVIRSDCGGRFGGYWADTGRTAVIGDPPPALERYFRAITAGIEAMLAAIRPGLPVRELGRLAVDTVRDHGIPHYRRHHVGHGIGLEMYEPPLLIGPDGSTDIHRHGKHDDVLEPGMVVNIELPYYELGLGGLQIEETLVVRESGHELLTRAPRGLFRIDASRSAHAG
jgi:Xaa-Pro dipeptidase